MTTIMLIPGPEYTSKRTKIKDHHLTVAYFGRDVTDGGKAALRRTIERIAYQIGGPIPAKANGIGMFDGGADGVAVVDLIDGIGTFRVRSMVEATFGGPYGIRVGAPIDYTHGFTPHITREYLDPEDDFYAEICVDMVPSVDFNFIAIGVWGGKDEDTKYEVEL